jgi:hypothetical protein
MLVALVAGGCGSSSPSLHLKSAAEARRQATAEHSEWERNALHFPPSHLIHRPWLVTRSSDPRLARLVRRYDFQLVSFHYFPSDQAALLVVETTRPLQTFAAEVSKIERAIDPVWHGGLSYHAFFFEARRDEAI